MQLVRYEAARKALADANRVDEVKDIRDKAKAMQIYAQQAKDRSLIMHATEIRMRAERRAGELLLEMPKNKGTRGNIQEQTGGRKKRPPDKAPKLSDLGITKDQSSRWQGLAKLEEIDFEQKIDVAVEKGISAIDRAERLIRTETPEKPPKPKKKKKPNPSENAPKTVDEWCARFSLLVTEALSLFEGKERKELLDYLKALIKAEE